MGRVVWPEKKDELLVRGYEIRRSDSFDLQSDLLEKLFQKILDEDNEGAVSLVRSSIQDTMAGKVPAEDLVISRTCKGVNAYANPDGMTNVQAAKKLVALGYEFIPGMKVSWIVTDGKAVPQQVEPFVSGKEFEHVPDYRYYAERLAQTASRITEVFGWSERDLMLGSQQATLFDAGFETVQADRPKAAPRTSAPAPKKKPSSLDDFF